MNPDSMEKKWYAVNLKNGKLLSLDDIWGKTAEGWYRHAYVLGDPEHGHILGNIHKFGGKTYQGCGWMEPQGEFSTYEKAREHVEAQTAEPENWEDICRCVDANWDISVSKFGGRWMDDILNPPGDAN